MALSVWRLLVLGLGEDLADPFAEILGERCELVAVGYAAETMHDPVAAAVQSTRIEKRDEAPDRFGRDRLPSFCRCGPVVRQRFPM